MLDYVFTEIRKLKIFASLAVHVCMIMIRKKWEKLDNIIVKISFMVHLLKNLFKHFSRKPSGNYKKPWSIYLEGSVEVKMALITALRWNIYFKCAYYSNVYSWRNLWSQKAKLFIKYWYIVYVYSSSLIFTRYHKF